MLRVRNNNNFWHSKFEYVTFFAVLWSLWGFLQKIPSSHIFTISKFSNPLRNIVMQDTLFFSITDISTNFWAYILININIWVAECKLNSNFDFMVFTIYSNYKCFLEKRWIATYDYDRTRFKCNYKRGKCVEIYLIYIGPDIRVSCVSFYPWTRAHRNGCVYKYSKNEILLILWPYASV